MNMKRFRENVITVVIIIALVFMLFILPSLRLLDAPILHYHGSDKVAGCLYVEYPNASGETVQDKDACRTYPRAQLRALEFVKHDASK